MTKYNKVWTRPTPLSDLELRNNVTTSCTHLILVGVLDDLCAKIRRLDGAEVLLVRFAIARV